MHVAFVVEHCHLRGGHERCVAEWARRLAARHRVTIVSHSVADLPEGLVRWIPVRPVDGPSALQYLGFYLRAGAIVRRLKGHVVHVQGPNCPVFDVSSIHTVVRAKYRILTKSREFRREMGLARHLSWRAHYLAAMHVEKRLFRRPKGMLLPVSRGVARELITAYGTPPDKVEPVSNGVDLDAFRPPLSGERAKVLETLGFHPDGHYALFVGGEWARKGLPFALEVMARCGGGIDLLVVGAGPEAHYRAQAQRRGIGDRVHFLGPRTDVAPLYRVGLALLMPSLYEAFSLVSLEAAASGLPVLASPVSGTEELIVDGENGWVLPADPEAWARRLDALAADGTLWARMSVRAREAASCFPWERAVERFEELYAR